MQMRYCRCDASCEIAANRARASSTRDSLRDAFASTRLQRLFRRAFAFRFNSVTKRARAVNTF
eukprot:11157442-Lingulodinium_polyedra.AAC.1